MYFVGVWETGPCALCKVTTSPRAFRTLWAVPRAADAPGNEGAV